jgi:hypothetical protein
MPSTVFNVMSQVWLEPGKTWHLKWNNATWSCVYAFNVQPGPPPAIGTVMEGEVTRVWREYIQKPTSGEAEVHALVKNTGSAGGYFFIFMSAVCG